MKNNRKVTYLLNYGEIDNLSCFIREKKDDIILIPNKYTVCFEANSVSSILYLIFSMYGSGEYIIKRSHSIHILLAHILKLKLQMKLPPSLR